MTNREIAGKALRAGAGIGVGSATLALTTIHHFFYGTPVFITAIAAIAITVVGYTCFHALESALHNEDNQ